MSWSNLYVGAPYEVYDCWRLVELVLNRDFAIACDLTADSPQYERFREDWQQVDTAEEGDLVLFSGHRHIGIMVTSELFLHTTSDTDAVVEKLDDFWGARVDGFYRHSSRAGDSLPVASGREDQP